MGWLEHLRMSVISLQPAPCFSADLLRPQQPRTDTRHHSSSAAMNEAGDWARVPGTATIQIRLLLSRAHSNCLTLYHFGYCSTVRLSLTLKPICGWVCSHEAKQELDGKSMTSKLLQCYDALFTVSRTVFSFVQDRDTERSFQKR